MGDLADDVMGNLADDVMDDLADDVIGLLCCLEAAFVVGNSIARKPVIRDSIKSRANMPKNHAIVNQKSR